MVAVRQKSPTALQNTKGGRGRGVAIGGRPRGWHTPALPREIVTPLTDRVQARFQPQAMRHARLMWREWWRSPASLGVDVHSDMEALTWWIISVFRRALYLQVVIQQPMVKGSMGQPVPNPLERVIGRLTVDINHAEDRFGMDTLSRFRLHFERQGQPVADDEDEMRAIEEYRRMLE